jgi:hypothetical protein
MYRYIAAMLSTILMVSSIIFFAILKTTSHDREFMANYHDFLTSLFISFLFFSQVLQLLIATENVKSDFEILIIVLLHCTIVLTQTLLISGLWWKYCILKRHQEIHSNYFCLIIHPYFTLLKITTNGSLIWYYIILSYYSRLRWFTIISMNYLIPNMHFDG